MSHSARLRRGRSAVRRAVTASGTLAATGLAAVAVFASAGSSAAATGHATVAGHGTAQASPVSAQSARSTRVHISNGTTTTLYRNYSSLSHGVWDDDTPPEAIDGGAAVVWGSHSSGLMTGTEGEVRYSVGNAGEVSIHWDNPYAGSNSYSCTAPAGYTCATTGGSGNNAEVWFTISGKVGAVASRGPRSASAARSTHVTLQNRTPNEMLRTSSSLVHGTWSENLLPPDHVYPMSNAIWQSESNGFATGTQGTAVYNMLNVGTVTVSWDNPYAGSNQYVCSPPDGYSCRQDGGGGDNAAVTFTVLKN